MCTRTPVRTVSASARTSDLQLLNYNDINILSMIDVILLSHDAARDTRWGILTLLYMP
jgi:hypothetical protein